MGRLTVITNLTLDGVMQAPGTPDEDTRDGFTHGGWAVPYSSDAMGRVMAEGTGEAALLLGRRTYENFAAYWPRQQDNPFTEVLNRTQKYVATRTLSEPLPWMNSTVVRGDFAELKKETDLVVLGSGDLAGTLIRESLVDEYKLLIHPLVLGSGRRLFPADRTSADLRLVDSVATTTGVRIASYQPA
jgi:dihydrofolate reductase